MQVLNLLLHQLTGREVDAAELAFLAVDEQLVDIGDDLFDYEVPENPGCIARAQAPVCAHCVSMLSTSADAASFCCSMV